MSEFLTPRPWRTLVRVAFVSEERRKVRVVIPGWDGGKQELELACSELPADWIDHLHQDFRFHCRVNVGARGDERITFAGPYELSETQKLKRVIVTIESPPDGDGYFTFSCPSSVIGFDENGGKRIFSCHKRHVCDRFEVMLVGGQPIAACVNVKMNRPEMVVLRNVDGAAAGNQISEQKDD